MYLLNIPFLLTFFLECRETIFIEATEFLSEIDVRSLFLVQRDGAVRMPELNQGKITRVCVVVVRWVRQVQEQLVVP